ncbi:hypothetical protein V6N13_071784 [Hibiscus sabdariffa]
MHVQNDDLLDGDDITADEEDMDNSEKDSVVNLADFAKKELGIMILGGIRCTGVDLFESALKFESQNVAIGTVWILENKDSLQ